MKTYLPKQTARVALVVVALLTVAAGVAYATIPASSGVIHGCYVKGSDDLRVVDPSKHETCNRTETALTWSQTGPQGPVGPRGVVGPKGPPGVSARPPAPEFVTVDCGAGRSVQQAINQANPTQPLTVTIKGTCTESVTISRDDVTLNANASGDGIQAPPGGFAALSLDSARRINLNQLTLTGGNKTLWIFNGSSFMGSQLHVSGASDVDVDVQLDSSGQLNNPVVDHAGHSGIQAADGGAVIVQGGTISNSGQFGAAAQENGSVSLGGTVISHSGNTGVYAAFGGSIDAGSITVNGSGSAGVGADGGTIHLDGNGGSLIEHNGYGIASNDNGLVDVQNGTRVTGNSNGGIIAFSSGALQLNDAIIENNTGNGITLANASSASIQASTISGNTDNGINVLDTSVAQFDLPSGSNTVTANGGWGVLCESSPSVALIRFPVGTVSGNSAGQINCPTA